jgi:hypothetical protein
MDNKKVGIIILAIGIILLFVVLQFMGGLRKEANDLGCYQNPGCQRIESNLGIAHLAFGMIGFIAALGFYMIIFSKGEKAILERLDEQKKKRSDEEEFELLLKGIGSYEKKALRAIKAQDGITQSTLQIKTGMSKAKLSYVLTDLEKRDLIKKIKKGKTYSVHLK